MLSLSKHEGRLRPFRPCGCAHREHRFDGGARAGSDSRIDGHFRRERFAASGGSSAA